MSDIRARQFGRYELLERLGAGGMAEVHRARYIAAPGITKPVVIKRVLGHYAEEPAFVEMFLNEARISVGLSHGNIVQVFDFGQVDGEYFLAMELVDGQPLSRVLKKSKAEGLPWLPAPLAVGIAIDMCRGLHYAHTHVDEHGEPLGLVHRDISPDNVLLSYEGEVKISDFGIAKARLEGRAETDAGIVKGKVLYFSPEQAVGERLDARSDVYAVGVVLYEMLCGHKPAEGSELEVMRRIVEGELTPARTHNLTLDAKLREILQQALATSKEERYPSAEALHQALSDWMGTRAPLFPTHTRKSFMAWLFRGELAALKRAPQLPPGFLQQVELWKCEALAPARPGALPQLERLKRKVPAPARPEGLTSPQRTRHKAALPTRPGALPQLDRLRRKVPAPPPGRLPWEVELPPAALAPTLPDPVPIPDELLRDTVKQAPRQVPVLAAVPPSGMRNRRMRGMALPVGGICVVSALLFWGLVLQKGQQDAVPSPLSGSAPMGQGGVGVPPARGVLREHMHAFVPTGHGHGMPLDPGRIYKLWVDERPSSAFRAELLLVLTDTRKGTPHLRLQVLSSEPLGVTGVSGLEAILLQPEDRLAEDATVLKIRDETSGGKAQMSLEPALLEVGPRNCFTVKGLQPRLRYDVVLLPVAGSRPATVVMLADSRASGQGRLHVLGAGRHTVSGAEELCFTMPRLKETAGTQMEVRVVEAGT